MIKLNERKSIKSNIIMNMILTMSSFLFPLISFPYISRILTPEGTGKVSFVTSIISYFSMFAQLGIPTYGIRACAKVRDDKIALSRTVHELLIINIIMNVISYSAFFLCLMTIPKMLEEKNLYFIISLTIILTSIGIEWLYKALEQYTYITVRSIFFKFIALILMFCLIKSKSDYIVYGAISIFASSASFICNFFNAKKYVRFKYIGDVYKRQHFNMEVIMNINKVVISSNSGYHFFRSREGSETTTVFDGLLYQKRREQFEHILKVYRIWNVENDNIMGSIYGYYASRLVQCIQEISISNVSDKRSLIRNIIYDQFNNYAIEKGKINSKLLRLAMYPMKYKNITLCLLVGKIIGFIKNHMSNFFYKIKSITVNKAIAERS